MVYIIIVRYGESQILGYHIFQSKYLKELCQIFYTDSFQELHLLFIYKIKKGIKH